MVYFTYDCFARIPILQGIADQDFGMNMLTFRAGLGR